MAKVEFYKDATAKTVNVFIRNTSVTSSISGLTGLTSGSLNCIYERPFSVATQLTLTSLASVTAAHLSGGFIEVSASGMPGIYRLDLADAMLASGADFVTVMLKGAPNMEHLPLEIQLIDTQNSMADAILTRNWSSVSGEAARSMLNALRTMRNKVEIVSGAPPVLKVYKEDDSTLAYQTTLTTDTSAVPIVSSTP